MSKKLVFLILISLVANKNWVFANEYNTGFQSIKNMKFNLGGELEAEFVDTQKDTSTTESNPHFQIDTFYLYPKITFSDYDFDLKGDLAFKTSSTTIEELYGTFSNLFLNSWLEVGLNDMFIANLDRKSEAEILIETAFYRSDDVGLTLGGEPSDLIYWRLSVTNGLKLGQKGPSEDSGYPLIYDARNVSSAGAQPMLGVGIGLKPDLGKFGKIDILPFYYQGKLVDADITFLNTISGFINTGSRKIRYGSNIRYDLGHFTLLGQYIQTKDGSLKRDGWFVQPSYKINLSARNIFKSFEFVYRYNKLDIILGKVFSDPLTWDRTQHVVAIITEIYSNINVKTEYYINKETTGAGQVKNDEFLAQLEIKF